MLRFGKAALYERLLREKDRQIDILAEQIDWLRAQLALTGNFSPGAPVNPSAQPLIGQSLIQDTPIEVRPYVTDEELDMEAMRENGDLDGLSKEQIAEVLEGLGLAPEFDLDNIDIQYQ